MSSAQADMVLDAPGASAAGVATPMMTDDTTAAAPAVSVALAEEIEELLPSLSESASDSDSEGCGSGRASVRRASSVGGAARAGEVVRDAADVIGPDSELDEEVVSQGSGGFDRSNASLAAERRRCGDEDQSTPGWARHRKHVFVLSHAGKPIYARYGDESKLSGLYGVMQAMVSFVTDNRDVLTHMVAGDHLFVFYQNGPLYYVAAASTGEPPEQLRAMLSYVHFLLVSVLTAKFIGDTLAARPQFDLRRMLGGTEPLLDALIESTDSELSFLTGAAQCLRLAAPVRAAVGATLQSVAVEGLTFALLVAERQLVTLVRPKARGLHPIDLLLILNFVRASTTLREREAESWTPFCFPHLNDTGHLYVYGHFIAPGLCLLLASVDFGAFESMRACKQTIVRELGASGALATIAEAQLAAAYPVPADVPGVLHFVYRSTSTRQFTAPAWAIPYVTPRERRRLFRLYQNVMTKLRSVSRSVRIVYQVGRSETVLAWVTAAFELYIVFGPLIGKAVAIAACNKLLHWIKANEDSLFILNSPVW